ncbi:MAG TPA: alpha/beta hydrolase, partial [Polymorphobacter sp.]|nr:alpha/beta hydrolase [Polymorphobacter sp.]
MTELVHHFTDLGDVTLHHVGAGRGEPVLLLHGWPETWFMWRDVIPLLAPHFEVIAPDLRGLGDSSRPEAGYDKATVARDIAALMTRLGHERFRVVAHDWGGPVAFALAAQFPDRVQAMAIFDAPVLGDGGPIEHHNRWHFGFHALPGLPEALTQGREDSYLRFFYRFGGARPDAISEAAQAEYVRAYAQPGAMTAGFNYYRAVPQDIAATVAFREAGKRLEMPILVYGGDPATRGRGMTALESWQRVAGNASGGVAENCGHWIPEERPDF